MRQPRAATRAGAATPTSATSDTLDEGGAPAAVAQVAATVRGEVRVYAG
ncbi:hypothetical protein [Micromonospora haikouensis]|nr:hypothetical protein [Micromonospora haikouensis]